MPPIFFLSMHNGAMPIRSSFSPYTARMKSRLSSLKHSHHVYIHSQVRKTVSLLLFLRSASQSFFRFANSFWSLIFTIDSIEFPLFMLIIGRKLKRKSRTFILQPCYDFRYQSCLKINKYL